MNTAAAWSWSSPLHASGAGTETLVPEGPPRDLTEREVDDWYEEHDRPPDLVTQVTLGDQVGARERGSISLELVILAPFFLLVILGLVFAGRVALAEQAVRAAAADGARSASIARTQGEAVQAASSTVQIRLAEQGLHCASTTVTADTAAFGSAPGTPGTVSVAVSCTVDLSDLAAPGIPGSMTLDVDQASPLDTYRERG